MSGPIGPIEESNHYGAVMTRFEDLPENIRALLLAKLAMELNTAGCANLYDLAKKRHSDLIGVWRGVCRIAGQPACAIPKEAMQPRG